MGEFIYNYLKKPRFIYVPIIILGIFLGVLSFFSLKIILLILLAIPLIIFAFFRPEIGLIIYIGTLPFNNYIPRTPGLEFVSVAVFLKLLIFISLIIKLVKKEIKFVNAPQNWAILGFTSIALISTSVASNLTYSSKYLWDLFHILILYFLIIHLINTKKLFKWTILVLVLSGFITALFSINQYLFGFSLRLSNNRIPGTFGNPNLFSVFLNFLIPLTLALFLIEKTTIKKNFFIIILPILFVAHFLTASRGGLISLVIIVFLLFLKQKNKLSILSIFLILFLIFSLFIPIIFWQRAGTLIGVTQGMHSERLRTGILRTKSWVAALKIFSDNFLIGVGPGNFINSMNYYLPSISKSLTNKATHSTYLQLPSELGIFGLFFFLTLLYLTYKDIKKSQKNLINDKNMFRLAQNLEIIFIGFMISFLFINILFFPFLWTLFALSIVLRNLNEKNKNIILN